MCLGNITGYEFLDYINIDNSFKKKENDIDYYYLYLNTDDLPNTKELESPFDLLEPYFKSVDDYYTDNNLDTSFIDRVFNKIADSRIILFQYDFMNLNITDISIREIIFSYFNCDKVFDKLEAIVAKITKEVV